MAEDKRICLHRLARDPQYARRNHKQVERLLRSGKLKYKPGPRGPSHSKRIEINE